MMKKRLMAVMGLFMTTALSNGVWAADEYSPDEYPTDAQSYHQQYAAASSPGDQGRRSPPVGWEDEAPGTDQKPKYGLGFDMDFGRGSQHKGAGGLEAAFDAAAVEEEEQRQILEKLFTGGQYPQLSWNTLQQAIGLRVQGALNFIEAASSVWVESRVRSNSGKLFDLMKMSPDRMFTIPITDFSHVGILKQINAQKLNFNAMVLGEDPLSEKDGLVKVIQELAAYIKPGENPKGYFETLRAALRGLTDASAATAGGTERDQKYAGGASVDALQSELADVSQRFERVMADLTGESQRRAQVEAEFAAETQRRMQAEADLKLLKQSTHGLMTVLQEIDSRAAGTNSDGRGYVSAASPYSLEAATRVAPARRTVTQRAGDAKPKAKKAAPAKKPAAAAALA